MFDTILFPVDFSKRSEKAARWVGAYARQFHSQVIFLHLVETPDVLFGMPEYGVVPFSQIRDEQMNERRQRLETWLAPEFAGISVRRVIAEGDPGGEIVRYAHENDVSLIMMPSHGLGPFRRFILGSTTAKVLHDAHVPVWTDAHVEENVGDAGELHKLVCAVDLGPQSATVLQAASAIIEQTEGEAVVVHAVPMVEARPASYFDSELAAHLSVEAHARAGELQKQLGTNFRVCVHGGDPADVVARAVASHKADLVVIARSAILSGLVRLRRHAYSIINKSPAPVLSV